MITVGTEPEQMVAPVVEIDTDPTFVIISWSALSEAFSGGVSVDLYKTEIQTSEGEFVEPDSCIGVTDLYC
jgi:hypothetical protein